MLKSNFIYINFIKIPVKKFMCFLRGIKSGTNTYISFKAGLKKPGQITLGTNVVVEKYARLECVGKTAEMNIGEATFIRPYGYIKADGSKVRIGKRCTFNDFSLINAVGDVTIGDDVHIASHVVIVSMNHIFKDPAKPIALQGSSKVGITIEDDIWIGTSAVILDGVTIGKGSVIAAGAVVTSSIPPYSIAAGVPARVIKKRG